MGEGREQGGSGSGREDEAGCEWVGGSLMAVVYGVSKRSNSCGTIHTCIVHYTVHILCIHLCSNYVPTSVSYIAWLSQDDIIWMHHVRVCHSERRDQRVVFADVNTCSCAHRWCPFHPSPVPSS